MGFGVRRSSYKVCFSIIDLNTSCNMFTVDIEKRYAIIGNGYCHMNPIFTYVIVPQKSDGNIFISVSNHGNAVCPHEKTYPCISR